MSPSDTSMPSRDLHVIEEGYDSPLKNLALYSKMWTYTLLFYRIQSIW